jgi:hypothetical protein
MTEETISTVVRAREDVLREKGAAMRAAFEAIAQPRSDFQLAHFVVAQHDTLPRQWAQAVLELQGRVFNIARIQADVELLELKLADELEAADAADGREKRRHELEGAKIRIALEETGLGRLGNVREAESLIAIVETLEAKNGGPFTREQIESDEARYWSLRLRRQAYPIIRGLIDQGNAEVLLQTLVEPGEERPPLLGVNETMTRLGVSPDGELAMLEGERDALEKRILELRGAPQLVGGNGRTA